MNVITILRGCPAVGKSTFVRENGLGDYTLSLDEIRKLFNSPYDDINELGELTKSTYAKSDKLKFELLIQLAENRMTKGEYIVVDAQNIDTKWVKQLKDLANKYHYRMNVVDFMEGMKLEDIIRNNQGRTSYEHVPESVIHKQFERASIVPIPSYLNKITKDEFEDTLIWKSENLDSYKKVVVIGDVHGSCTVLKELIGETLSEDTFYIFLGDLFDRGIENTEVFEFLYKHKDAENLVLLKGNHETHLYRYVRSQRINNQRTREETIAEFEKNGIDKRRIKYFLRKFQAFFAFNYQGKEYICNHGGVLSKQLNVLDKGLYKMMTLNEDSLITGIGGYEYDIDKEFSEEQKQSENPIYQFHGHRNIKNLSISPYPYSFNLEGKVEEGGYLRAVSITKDGVQDISIKNNTFALDYLENSDVDLDKLPKADVLAVLKNSKYIREKTVSKGITSYNFTRKAFTKGVWNNFSTTARGLFLDEEGSIVGRGYPKFFNLNENEETMLENVQGKIQYPVKKLVKENGFLGIMCYSEVNKGLLHLTKSGYTPYAKIFRDMFNKHVGRNRLQDNLKDVVEYIKKHNISVTFEVIDMERDPHIIRYEGNKLVLLHAVENKFNANLCEEHANYIAEKLHLQRPEVTMLETESDLMASILEHEILENSEGSVYIDANQYMFKVKTKEYSYYKGLRGRLESYTANPELFTKEGIENKEKTDVYIADLMYLLEYTRFDISNPMPMVEIIPLLQARKEG